MIDFKDKNILFISPCFFGYEKAILSKLEELGAKVDFYDERPVNNFLGKGLIRINKRLLSTTIKKYYNEIYSRVNRINYDYVLVINIEAMPCSFLSRMREKNPSAKFILYMWDSISNKKNTKSYFDYFDRIFSFDKNDCQNCTNIKFRPLFYIDDYANLKSGPENYQYDVSFVGTGHSDRHFILRKMSELFRQYDMGCFTYVYLQSKKLYYWNKLTNPHFKKCNVDDFKYASLDKTQVLDIISKSRIIIDIQHPAQTGLTMRTIEMLGAKKKLITTNASVKEYDFYDPNNIWVIDRKRFFVPLEFMRSGYAQPEEDLYYKYSIKGWIEELFQ